MSSSYPVVLLLKLYKSFLKMLYTFLYNRKNKKENKCL